MISAILFDLDGTLIDSRRDLAEAVNAALSAVGLPTRTLDEVTAFIGEGSRRLVEKAIAPRLELLDQAHTAWEEAYRAGLLRHTRFYPGMRELSGVAAQTLLGNVAIHTNKPGAFARPILAGLGAEQLFARVLGGGDGPARKPSPEGAQQLLAAFGVAPGEAAYVGDSLVDFETARALGAQFFGCSWGYGDADLLRARGARVARDVAELSGWLSLVHRS